MNKLMKRISTLVLAIGIAFGASGSIKAFESEVKLSNSIIFKTDIKNAVFLSSELSGANVYQQHVIITKDVFEKIRTAETENQKFVEERTKLEEAKEAEVKAAKEVRDALEIEAAKEDATAEVKAKFAEANEKYTTLLNELGKLREETPTLVLAKNEEYKKLIPSFDESKWTKLSNSSADNGLVKYEIALPTSAWYSVSWVKVEQNGVVSYQYALYCYTVETSTTVKNETETKKEVKEETTKNPETGIESYYAYGIVLVSIAACLYITVQSRKKFSK